MKQRLYISTYNKQPQAHKALVDGIYLCELDEESGQLELLDAFDGGPNPSFLALSLDGSRLFAANETNHGHVSSYSVDRSSGRLTFIDQESAGGDDPCHVSLDPSEMWLLVSCYTSGNFSVLPVLPDGSLGKLVERVFQEGRGPNEARQDHAHAHSTWIAPGGKFIFTVDLGVDAVNVYSLESDTGKLILNDPPGLKMHPGAGPRHLTCAPDGRMVYVSNELDSTVSACSWDGQAGVLAHLQTLSTLDGAYHGENAPADIHLTPSGEFLYVSNRGENSIAGFAVDKTSGRLHKIGTFSCGGNWPRNFAIDPQGKYLLAANQESDSVVVLRIERDGSLIAAGPQLAIPAPVCVCYLPAKMGE